MSEHIYRMLVRDEEDVVGALAYSLYKMHKIEWLLQYKAEHDGRSPTPADLDAFHSIVAQESQIKGLLERGHTLATRFINNGLEQHDLDKEAELLQSALAHSLSAVVQRKLDEKRSWRGWLADGMSALLVNLLTIVIIGAAVLGLRASDALTAHTGQAVGTSVSPPVQSAPAAR